MNFRFSQTRNIIKNIRDYFNGSNKTTSSQSRESLTKNVLLLTQSFEKYTANRESGDGILSNPSRPNLNQEKALNLPLQILQAGVTGGVNTAFLLYAKSVMLDFSYLKEPTFSAASNALSGYYSVLINSFAEREKINLQYDLLRISSLQSLALTHTIPASFAFLRSLNFGKTFATKTITGTVINLTLRSFARLGLTAIIRYAAARLLPAALLRTGARAAAATAVAPGVGTKLVGIGSVVLESILFAIAIDKIINEQKNNKDLEEYANNKAFLDLLNPNNIVPLYRQTLSLLMESNSLDFSRLIGPGRNSFSSDVYSSSMLNLKRVGVQTEDILRLATDLSKSTPVDFNQLDLLTAHTLDYSLMFTGGDSKGVSSIMTSIIRATPFSSGDVNLAVIAFEDFFARIVGNGQPQGAHFRLIQALAEFSNSYGAVERLSGTAPLEISKINQFMSDNGSINGRFDVSATMDVVRTADDIILKGALSADTASRAVFVNSGMSVEEAIRGVTHNAETFVKFLNGIVESMGLSREDIPTGEVSDNSIYSNQLRNTAYVLGLNTRQTQVLNHALRRYAMGHDVTSIMSEYDESSKNKFSLESNLNKFINFIKDTDTFTVLENLTISNNKLVEATNMYAEKIILLQTAVQALTFSNFQRYSDFIVLTTKILLNQVPQVLAPTLGVGSLNPTDTYVPPPAGTTVPGDTQPPTVLPPRVVPPTSSAPSVVPPASSGPSVVPPASLTPSVVPPASSGPSVVPPASLTPSVVPSTTEAEVTSSTSTTDLILPPISPTESEVTPLGRIRSGFRARVTHFVLQNIHGLTARAGGSISGGGDAGGSGGESGGRGGRILLQGYDPGLTAHVHANRGKFSGSYLSIASATENAYVYAAHDGEVVFSGNTGANEGYMVIIRDKNGLFASLYGNLQDSERVQVQQNVVKGQKIGKLGGGALIPPNVLRFYIRDLSGGGESSVFAYPKEYLQEFFPDENFDFFAMGGFVFNKNKASSTVNTNLLTSTPRTMTIKIPIFSTNPSLFAKEFSDLMQKNV